MMRAYRNNVKIMYVPCSFIYKHALPLLWLTAKQMLNTIFTFCLFFIEAKILFGFLFVS